MSTTVRKGGGRELGDGVLLTRRLADPGMRKEWETGYGPSTAPNMSIRSKVSSLLNKPIGVEG